MENEEEVNNIGNEEVKKPIKSRSRAKGQNLKSVEENFVLLYLKGIEVKETILKDDRLRHDRTDCDVYITSVAIKGEIYKKLIRFNKSRGTYQGLIELPNNGGLRSLSFFPHVEHAEKALNTYLEKMM